MDSNIENRIVRHLRSVNTAYACMYCHDRHVLTNPQELWAHAQSHHQEKVPEGAAAQVEFRRSYEQDSKFRRSSQDSLPSRRVLSGKLPKRPLDAQPTISVSGLGVGDLNLGRSQDDTYSMTIDSLEANASNQPRKRAAVGDGVSAGSTSPLHDRDSSGSPPLRSSFETDFRQQQDDIQRPLVQRRQLWSPETDTPFQRSSVDLLNTVSSQVIRSRAQGLQSRPRKPVQTPTKAVIPRQQVAQDPNSPSLVNSRPPVMTILTSRDEDQLLPQPETRAISQEQLLAEVKGIYAGLVMVETKCMEVDSKHATIAQADPANPPRLNNEQWQAMIALHRTLLHEHHDFFLASQHPSASVALRRLAVRYAMPARMWRHGIYSFLELLRHRLPSSLDHMLSFIYIAYSMMALLYETVPAFEDTWIECLGDLGRYRMAIEDDDIGDREIWTGVSKHWYAKASEKSPTTGRLYHHLAILARPDSLKQLFYYSKSLCVAIPFVSARESILMLFQPVLSANTQTHIRGSPFDHALVKAHACLFTGEEMQDFEPTLSAFTSLLDSQIGRTTSKFITSGYQIAIANTVALLGFGSEENPLMQAMILAPSNPLTNTISDTPAYHQFLSARCLHHRTAYIVLNRIGDPNVLSYVHVTLLFLLRVSHHTKAISLVFPEFPFGLLARFLNTLLPPHQDERDLQSASYLEKSSTFPVSEHGDTRILPEDRGMRGLLFVDGHGSNGDEDNVKSVYPEGFFGEDGTEDGATGDDDRRREIPSIGLQRKERVIWLARRLTEQGGIGLRFNETARGGSFASLEGEEGVQLQMEREVHSNASALAADVGSESESREPSDKGSDDEDE